MVFATISFPEPDSPGYQNGGIHFCHLGRHLQNAFCLGAQGYDVIVLGDLLKPHLLDLCGIDFI